MTTIHSKWDGSHLYRNVNDNNPLKKKLSSFKFLYEWLPFLFEWIVVMHISVRMTTISFWLDFRHAHFCTNDYHFVLYGFSSCIFCAMTFHILCIWNFVMPFLWKWLSILLNMDFRHAYSVQWLSIFFWFSMMCAKLFNGWIAWSSDEL